MTSLAERHQAISAAYRDLQSREGALGATPGFVSRTADYAAGAWGYDEQLLDLIPAPLAGMTVLDYGAKYGHTAPVFLARGAKRVIAVDVEDEYLEAGAKVLGTVFPQVQYLRSERGMLALQPETVDLILVNEVISHINPAYLENFYADCARVLTPGGFLLISDGNNLANVPMRAGLPDIWDAWENGPEGRKTERDVVAIPYIQRRANIISKRHPGLAADKIDYLARNTSGLFGEGLLAAVDAYVRTGSLTERPYRYGTCPTNPGPGGVVMERAFWPTDVARALELQALTAKQVFHSQYAEAIKSLPQGTDLTGTFSMFQILAQKPA